jgi:hypothetical protein
MASTLLALGAGAARSGKTSPGSSSVLKTMNRPTIEEVHLLLQTIPSFSCPKTSNKGLPGVLLEKLTGIPQSSAHLDCANGELKLFPVKRLKNGTLVPKETIAVTMLNTARLAEEADFATSHCGTKLKHTLFVPYLREEDMLHFFPASIVTMSPDMCAKLGADYTAIREGFLKDGTLTSKTGIYLQNRTKGAGGDAPKTRAFYLRKEFIDCYVTKTW